ncbi:hypothetical protein SLEP1_g43744 [Rubroshorea leprosula]|uniref:Peptidase S54 rhomboid domain-containing protein n=1 Tax=Rubroshorea leprosula TaxID=152421 RepID=A0AAV5LES2_9ROSI|nr:hypothetical protein SLEP1_g43744 [Rubroshorea leprosula]
MLRLLAHKLASSLLQNTATSSSSVLLLHSVPYKTFSSVTKTRRLNQLLNSPPTHPFHRCIPLPWRSQHTLAGAIDRFLSIPVVANRLLTNFSITHFRILSRSISDCRVWFLQQRPDFSRNFRYQNSGWRSSWFQQLTANDMVLGLLVSNVAVFLLWRIADQKFMMNNFTISVENFKSGRLHTLITSAFSHIDIEHIVSNMIGLYFFGISILDKSSPMSGRCGPLESLVLKWKWCTMLLLILFMQFKHAKFHLFLSNATSLFFLFLLTDWKHLWTSIFAQVISGWGNWRISVLLGAPCIFGFSIKGEGKNCISAMLLLSNFRK